MKTTLQLRTLGILLACGGMAQADNTTPTGSFDYPPGPVRINPQPLPPSQSTQAAIALSTPDVAAGLQAVVPAPISPETFPMINVPLLVAPTACSHGCGPFALRLPSRHSYLLLAGGDPTTVRDSRSGPRPPLRG